MTFLDPLFLRQGKFQKTKSLIDDEVVKSVCLSFLRSPANIRTAELFERWVNDNLKSEIGIDYEQPSLDEQPLIGFHSWIFNIRTIDKAAPSLMGTNGLTLRPIVTIL